MGFGVQTLSADYLLRKHNMEIYLMKRMDPKLYFLGILPTANTDTGEFATVLKSPTAAEDIANDVTSEPLDVTELSDFTKIDISPLNAVLGRTNAVGYSFEYSQKFLNRSDAGANVNLALSKVAAGMAIKINSIILSGLVSGAEATFPSDLSHWSTEIDPRIDARKLRTAFSVGTDPSVDLPFNLDTAFIDYVRADALEDYYTSFDWDFTSGAVNVDGTTFNNVKNSFKDMPNVNFVGIDSTVPPGIIETYVDPNFSTIQQSIEQDPQSAIKLPPAMININKFQRQEGAHNTVFEIWAEIGYSNQEPLGAVAGNLQ